jgi:uncharacterized membrane protein
MGAGGEKIEKIICVLCNTAITPNAYGWAYGNNPAPLAEEGRCCDACNAKVIVARLKVVSDKQVWFDGVRLR